MCGLLLVNFLDASAAYERIAREWKGRVDLGFLGARDLDWTEDTAELVEEEL